MTTDSLANLSDVDLAMLRAVRLCLRHLMAQVSRSSRKIEAFAPHATAAISPHKSLSQYSYLHQQNFWKMLRAAVQRSAPRATNGAIRLMSKEIKFGVEGRAAMLRGVDLLANTVQVRIDGLCVPPITFSRQLNMYLNSHFGLLWLSFCTVSSGMAFFR